MQHHTFWICVLLGTTIGKLIGTDVVGMLWYAIDEL
jgi:hypothetical protein